MSSCGNESGLVVRGTRTGGRTDILSVPLQKQQGQDGPATHGQDAHATPPRPPGEGEVPGQSRNRAAWKYVLLALIFLTWFGFLIYCALV